MTIPQFDDTPSEIIGGGEKRDSSEFIPWTRVAEVKTPRGTRPGLVLIVRPLERIRDYRDKDPANDWKTLVIADIAVLDPIPPGADEYGMMLDPIAPGSQWRNQTVFPGMLNKAWRDKIGNTLIGVVYIGEAKPTPQGTMGKPPFLWRSLSQDTNQTSRGQRFFVARPEFLIPVPRSVAATAAQADDWARQTGTPVQDPWDQPRSTTPNQAQYATQYSDPYAANGPHAPAVYGGPQLQQHPGMGHDAQGQWIQAQSQPTQGYALPVSPAPAAAGYQQPDPWAQQPAAPVSPGPQVHPNQGMNTLQQIKAAQTNHQGNAQDDGPPF